MSNLGKRICIIGPSSSGKSTLAQKIGLKNGFPVLHLDQIAHIPGTNWKRCPMEQLVQKHDAFILNDYWVIEGNYQKLMPQRFERAQTVIVHHFNRLRCVYRFIKRSLQKNRNRPGMLEGSADKLNWEMVSYILFKAPKRMKQYAEMIKLYPHLNVIHVYSFKEVEKLLKED